MLKMLNLFFPLINLYSVYHNDNDMYLHTFIKKEILKYHIEIFITGIFSFSIFF